MNKRAFFISIVAFAIICSQSSLAYSYWNGNYQTIYPSYDRPYLANDYGISGGNSFTQQPHDGFYVSSGTSNYRSPYKGGFYPVYYEAPRTYGYQGGAFTNGPDYGKMFRSRSMSWQYGRGSSDYFYDGYFRQTSKYYVYT